MMDERLKQIWSGFEETTSRNLTGRGVENINVPYRVDYRATDEELLPEQFDAPAEAAFTALHDKLKRQEKMFAGKGRKKRAGDDDAEISYGESELLRSLNATSMRVERPENDYTSYLASDDGKRALKRIKKKKRFGLF